MSRDDIPWIGLLAALLIGSLLIGQRFLHEPGDVSVPQDRAGGWETFRQWLWAHRSLDLVVQAGLILVGALGIAALLPRSKEDM
jgi:hypothetical protein